MREAAQAAEESLRSWQQEQERIWGKGPRSVEERLPGLKGKELYDTIVKHYVVDELRVPLFDDSGDGGLRRHPVAERLADAEEEEDLPALMTPLIDPSLP